MKTISLAKNHRNLYKLNIAIKEDMNSLGVIEDVFTVVTQKYSEESNDSFLKSCKERDERYSKRFSDIENSVNKMFNAKKCAIQANYDSGIIFLLNDKARYEKLISVAKKVKGTVDRGYKDTVLDFDIEEQKSVLSKDEPYKRLVNRKIESIQEIDSIIGTYESQLEEINDKISALNLTTQVKDLW